MKKWEKVVGIIYVVFLIVAGVISIYMWWKSEVEVYSYKKRAQVAAEAEDLLMYMKAFKEGMEKWKMTKGHYALIFKTPWNDAELDYKAVCRIIERTEKLTKIDKISVEYQTGMDDVRGIIRELEMDVFYFWALHTTALWGFWVSLFAMWSWFVIFVYICIRIAVTKTKEDKRFYESLKKERQ